MMRPTHVALKHPYRFTAVLAVAVIVVYVAAAPLLKLPSDNTGIVYLIANVVLAALGAVLLTAHRAEMTSKALGSYAARR
jgi:hypothetical protein